MTPTDYLAFQKPEDLSRWLGAHLATASELWVRIYKKQSGTASVTWEGCVVAGLAWGWIDGQKTITRRRFFCPAPYAAAAQIQLVEEKL